MKCDLNCDLGEGEPSARTRSLMRWVTSVNVACGGHAGDARSMTSCVRWARQLGVRLGAHPGLPSRHDFGRGQVDLTSKELETLLLHQVGALHQLAQEEGFSLQHVKLHGALYHAAESQGHLRRAFVEAMRRWWPHAAIYAPAGGNLARLARRQGLRVAEEGFLDRAYLDARTLAPRSQPGALWTDADKIIERLRHWRRTGHVLAESGKSHRLPVASWCVHGDTPGALRLARAAAEEIRRWR